jgi:hypothetical protein
MQSPQVLRAVLAALPLIKGDSLALPLPRRLELSAVQLYRSLVLGDLQRVYEKYIKAKNNLTEFMSNADAEIQQTRLGSSIGAQALRNGFIVSKHLVEKGALYSVSDPLEKLLADTRINENLPVKYFSAPSSTAYIEFCAPEHRSQFHLSTYSEGMISICEGCYIQEKRFERLPLMLAHTQAALELDPHKATRVLDIGLTASPIGYEFNTDIPAPIISDTMDTITLFIQDENEPFAQVLARHFAFYDEKAAMGVHEGVHNRTSFKARIQENFAYLTKVMFYLSMEPHEQREVREASELQRRINTVSPKKRDKLERALNRVYDRIIVGPKTYSPLPEGIDTPDVPNVTKPH